MEKRMVEKSHMAGWLPEANEPLRNFGQKIADWFAPPSDASAAEECYDINIELPGVEPDDIDVAVEGNSLTIRGEKHSSHEESGRSYFFSERQYGAFQRTFRLPPDFDPDRLDATFNNGVLHLRIGKVTPDKPVQKKIKIKKK